MTNHEGAQRNQRARIYDALSRWYGLLAESSEGPLRRKCLELLCLRPGERVLEIGSGPGTDLPTMAARVGGTGCVLGLDLSQGMLRECRRMLARHRRPFPIYLIQGDGLHTPFRDGAFDVVLLSFTLELFGDEEILCVLQEVRRVMRAEARLGVVSLSSNHRDEPGTRIYRRLHRWLPALVDCRPMQVGGPVGASGFEVLQQIEQPMWGLWVTVLVARRR